MAIQTQRRVVLAAPAPVQQSASYCLGVYEAHRPLRTRAPNPKLLRELSRFAEWQEYVWGEGGCRIVLPGTPDIVQPAHRDPDGLLRVSTHGGKAIFELSYFDEYVAPNADRSAVLDTLSDGLVAQRLYVVSATAALVLLDLADVDKFLASFRPLRRPEPEGVPEGRAAEKTTVGRSAAGRRY